MITDTSPISIHFLTQHQQRTLAPCTQQQWKSLQLQRQILHARLRMRHSQWLLTQRCKTRRKIFLLEAADVHCIVETAIRHDSHPPFFFLFAPLAQLLSCLFIAHTLLSPSRLIVFLPWRLRREYFAVHPDIIHKISVASAISPLPPRLWCQGSR